MRDFLLTKFKCAVCGHGLELSYDAPMPKNEGWKPSGEPTGAHIVSMSVAIVPCRNCLQPLAEAKDALAKLLKIGAGPCT